MSFLNLGSALLRKSVRIISVAFAVIVVASLALAGWLWTSLPKIDGTVEIKGIQGPVRIYRDPIGVPTIQAASDDDAYFALGYVHAQDRFWQMETMRRLGQGRLAEIFGERALPSDRWFRTLGLNARVKKDFSKLSAPVQKAIKSYTRGVNQWLQGKSGLLSPEFAIFRYQPEKWQPTDSLLWGKIMAMRLSGNWPDEVLRTLLARKLTPAQVRDLWPGPKSVPVSSLVPSAEIMAAFGSTDFELLASLAPWPSGLPKGASNTWVVSANKTTTGKPLLANDPHLGFTAPIVWYMAKIISPNLNVTGATVPGVPFHVLGHTEKIAWGITSAQADLQDLVIEKISPGNPNQYITPTSTQLFERRNENIVVKDADNVRLNIQSSRNGPIISGLLPGLEKLTGKAFAVALKATFLEVDDRSVEAFYDLNRASSMVSFKNALKKLQSPQLNFSYADVRGNIGHLSPGLVPIRQTGQGLVPVTGWEHETIWQKFIPFEELPGQFNPPANQYINANNAIVDDNYPYFIGRDWAPGYRARQIKNQLIEQAPHSLRTFSKIQLNINSLMANDLLPIMTGFEVLGKKQREVIALLNNWDGDMGRDRPEPLLFYSWLRALNISIYGDELGDLTNSYLTLRPRFIKQVLTRNNKWCDDVTTPTTSEDCKTIVNRALNSALQNLARQYGAVSVIDLDLAALKWGDRHQAWFQNRVLGEIPLIGKFANLQIPSEGGDYTINRGATHTKNPETPFRHVHGPGFRAIYDLSDMDKSRFMIATGQSGNILSSWYGDMVEVWQAGGYRRLNMSERELQYISNNILVLKPAEKQKP